MSGTSAELLATKLTATRDGNATEYRYGGILLERCLVVNGHPQEHMIPVVRRLRAFNQWDLKTARSCFDSREIRGNSAVDR